MRLLLRSATVMACLALPGCAHPPCSEITNLCDCYHAYGCRVVVDTCFCPSQCGEHVECTCGGGTFLRCEDQSPDATAAP